MGEGIGVNEAISVGVSAAVIVGVSVGVACVLWEMLPVGLVMRSTTKTKTAPTIRNTASRPSAAGKLNVISGIRLALTPAGFFASTVGWSSVPQTRQRVAFSARRVPQVGQIFVLGVDVVSGLIRDKIIPCSKGVKTHRLAQKLSFNKCSSRYFADCWAGLERNAPVLIKMGGWCVRK